MSRIKLLLDVVNDMRSLADSIQAVVDYNYDLLDAIEVFAPNQMTKE